MNVKVALSAPPLIGASTRIPPALSIASADHLTVAVPTVPHSTRLSCTLIEISRAGPDKAVKTKSHCRASCAADSHACRLCGHAAFWIRSEKKNRSTAASETSKTRKDANCEQSRSRSHSKSSATQDIIRCVGFSFWAFFAISCPRSPSDRRSGDVFLQKKKRSGSKN